MVPEGVLLVVTGLVGSSSGRTTEWLMLITHRIHVHGRVGQSRLSLLDVYALINHRLPPELVGVQVGFLEAKPLGLPCEKCQ